MCAKEAIKRQPENGHGVRHSLRRQLLVLVSVSLATLLLVQGVCLSWFSKLTQKQAFHYAQDSLSLISAQIVSMFEDMEQLVFNVAFSKYIQEYLTTDDAQRKYIELYPVLLEMLDNMSASNNNIYDIMLFGKANGMALSLQQAHSLSVYDQLQIPQNPAQLAETAALPAVVYGNAIYYPFARDIYSSSQRGFMGKIGTCIALCDGKAVQQLVDSSWIVDNTRLFVVDRYGTIIASNRREQIGTQFDVARYAAIDGDQRIMDNGTEAVIQHASAREWMVFSVVPVNALLQDVRRVMYFCIGIMTVAAAFVLLIGTSISRHINRSVARIVQFMKDVTSGQREKRFHLKDMDEITAIAESANQMLDQMEETNRSMLQAQSALYEAKLLERQAQFMALQRQINPHFLFNTLNCISGIAAVHGVSEIVQISSAMGQIFRYCIKDADIVPLREEMEIVQRYLDIIELRYRGKIRGTIDMQADLVDERLPKMILQPLVENAVFHGLEPKREGGHIWIRARRCPDDMIAFEIQDDGIGMAPENVRQMKMAFQADAQAIAAERKNRIGMANIVGRIHFLFGERAHLELESELGQGTKVVVFIPIISQNKQICEKTAETP